VQPDIESALIGINHLVERLELSRRTIQRNWRRATFLHCRSAAAASSSSPSCTDGLMAAGRHRKGQ
jgi:hypothetical protein